MKKSKYNFLLLLFYIPIFNSCTNHNEIEQIFINEDNEYWACYNQQQSTYVYFQFHNNATFDQLAHDSSGDFILTNRGGDVMHSVGPWSVTKDSILTWGPHTYDILNYNENAIVLLFVNPETKLQSHTILIKEKSPNYRKSPAYYEQKRKANPKKYPQPFLK